MEPVDAVIEAVILSEGEQKVFDIALEKYGYKIIRTSVTPEDVLHMNYATTWLDKQGYKVYVRRIEAGVVEWWNLNLGITGKTSLADFAAQLDRFFESA